MSVCVLVDMDNKGACRLQRKTSKPLDLELQELVSCRVGAGKGIKPSARAANPLHH